MKDTVLDTRFGRMGRVVTGQIEHRHGHTRRQKQAWTEPGYYKLLRNCKGNSDKFARAIVSMTRKFSHGDTVNA